MDLVSLRPFWPLRDGLPAAFPPLTTNTSCDVAVIGAGISGALTATLLAEAGLETVVLDRREAAHGSTAANTGLVLYELDVMLHRLGARFGTERAARAYRRCRDTVAALALLVRRTGADGGFERRQILYLAATPAHVSRLRREYDARLAADLAVEWWSRSRIAAESSLPHSAAIWSRDAAQVDPYRLTYGLLRHAQQAGVRIHDRTNVMRWKHRPRGVDLWTERGQRVRARHLVVASGYESDAFLPRRVGRLYSTYAVISEPMPERAFSDWPARRCLMWDTANPYLYFRTTHDNRMLIGGYDERYRGPKSRDRMLPAKAAALARRARQFFPHMPFERHTAWAGTFATTRDGLPYVGPHAEVPHTWFALGFGGNGIVFSLIAAEIIRDGLLGRRDPDAELFGFER